MSKKFNFEESLHKARRRIYYLINEKSRNHSEIMSKNIAEIFRDRARARLLKYAAPFDDNSSVLVENLAQSIDCRPVQSGYWSIRIPADPEGLFLFLEFGTGLIGEENITSNIENPSADPVWNWVADVSWAYGRNRDNYKNGGWFFQYDGTQYLDESDGYPLQYEKKHTRPRTGSNYRVKSYTRTSKNGNVYRVSSYSRKSTERPSKRSDSPYAKTQKTNVAFSKGLFPTRYIYDTKQEIIELFRKLAESRKTLKFKDVYDEIDRLRSSDV